MGGIVPRGGRGGQGLPARRAWKGEREGGTFAEGSPLAVSGRYSFGYQSARLKARRQAWPSAQGFARLVFCTRSSAAPTRTR